MNNEKNQVVMRLVWSENFPPNQNCRYDHCYAETPFGKFLMTWKGWKTEPWKDMGITFDQTPWDEFFIGGWGTVEEAKEAAQAEFNKRVVRCLNT